MTKKIIISLIVLLGGTSVKAGQIEATELLSVYVPVHVALSGDDVAAARVHTATLKGVAEKLQAQLIESDPQGANLVLVVSGSEILASSITDEEARLAFGTLAKGIVEFIRNDAALQASWQLFFCSMTKPYGFWVQPKGVKITNPYWGSKMLHCGSKKNW